MEIMTDRQTDIMDHREVTLPIIINIVTRIKILIIIIIVIMIIKTIIIIIIIIYVFVYRPGKTGPANQSLTDTAQRQSGIPKFINLPYR